jgi:subtilisin family serine protease
MSHAPTFPPAPIRLPRRTAAVVALVALLLSAGSFAVNHATRMVPVIVREAPGTDGASALEVQRLGGHIGMRLGIIDGYKAVVPAESLDEVTWLRGVQSVTPDASVKLLHQVDGFDGASDTGSIYNLTKSIKAQDVWRNGHTGQGVDVALIDSGVVPVNGLTTPGKIINGPDLSFESQGDTVRYLDTYGHGTHMAGIIGGKGDTVASSSDYTNHDKFVGVAPDSRILSIKVAASSGATDVSQVIAAIDWVVQHRNDNGMNVRVLNLSFGTDGVQDYTLDPLAYAAEVAWRKGIVVVVAAGNTGYGTAKLNNPAYDPYVIAVGADDTRGTFTTDDDTIPEWSTKGDGTRNPDVVAPGKSLQSLRAPGSYIDQAYPGGRINNRFFRGSGTSQATAAVSGAAALLLSQRPNLTPDQVKRLLMTTASALPAADPVAQGSGLINMKAALAAPTPNYTQTWATGTGTGSLEAARGSSHVSNNGVDLVGEQDIFGHAWDGTTWSGTTWSGTTWSGGDWNGTTWSGGCWCGTTWSGTTWSGTTWSGTTWSGTTWSGTTWSGTTWSGTTWSGTTWSGTTWSGTTWSGTTWSGTTWSGTSWSSALWGDDYHGETVA